MENAPPRCPDRLPCTIFSPVIRMSWALHCKNRCFSLFIICLLLFNRRCRSFQRQKFQFAAVGIFCQHPGELQSFYPFRRLQDSAAIQGKPVYNRIQRIYCIKLQRQVAKTSSFKKSCCTYWRHRTIADQF